MIDYRRAPPAASAVAVVLEVLAFCCVCVQSGCGVECPLERFESQKTLIEDTAPDGGVPDAAEMEAQYCGTLCEDAESCDFERQTIDPYPDVLGNYIVCYELVPVCPV
jgi:hypothetical protein